MISDYHDYSDLICNECGQEACVNCGCCVNISCSKCNCPSVKDHGLKKMFRELEKDGKKGRGK